MHPVKRSIAMAAYPKTKKLAPSRAKAITGGHKEITGFIPKIQDIEANVAKEEKAAEALNAKVDKVGLEVMTLLEGVALEEPKSVYNLQVIAREKKDDYLDAAALMKGLATVEKKRAKLVKSKKFDYEKTRMASMEAEEEYDHKELDSRAITWTNYLTVDKARHRQQRGMDDKQIEIARRLFFQKELNKAKDAEKNLGKIADARVSEAKKAVNAAMANDEKKMLLQALKAAKLKAAETKEKKASHDRERKMKTEAKEAEQKENAKKGNSTNSTKKAIDPDAILEAAEEATEAAQEEAAENAKAGGDARESMRAVERAEKSFERNGKAQVIAAAAITAEDTARKAQLKLQRAMDLNGRLAKKHDAGLVQAKVRAAGEEYIGRKAGSAMVKVQAWVQTTELDKSDQDRLLARTKDTFDKKKKAFLRLREEQTVAENKVRASQYAVIDSTQASRDARTAMMKASVERRKAWRAAYKAGSAAKMLGEVGVELGRVALENEQRARSIIDEANQVMKAASGKLQDKQKKLLEAKKLHKDAIAKKDHDYKMAALNSIATMKGAVAAHGEAHKAVTTMVEAMKKEAAAIQGKASALRTAIKTMGGADAEELAASKRAEKTTVGMRLSRVAWRKTLAILKKATEELTEAKMVAANKKKRRARAEWIMGRSKFRMRQRQRYRLLAMQEKKKWVGNLNGEVAYGKACAKSTTNAMGVHAMLKKKGEPQWKKAKDTQKAAVTALKMITDEEKSVNNICAKAGSIRLSDLLQMRKKWALLYFEDAKLQTGAWTVLVKSTEQPVLDAKARETLATKALKVEIKQAEKNVAEVAEMSAAAKLVHAKALMKEEMFRKDAAFAGEQWDTTKAEIKKMDATFAFTEAARTKSTLKALFGRVESMWQRGNAKEVRDPKAARYVETARFKRIIAMWDRDGAPIGPGSVDAWMNDFQGFLERRSFGASSGKLPNCLKSAVRNRCSQQCQKTGAMIQCSNGVLSRACSFGMVMRVRFEVKDVMRASSDYWVCRCNSGVMQYTTQEKWKVVRKKEKLLQVNYTPEDIDFSRRLHENELLPDKHTHCFRDFVPWLKTKADYVKKPCAETPAELKLEEYNAPEFKVGKFSKAKEAVLWQLQGLRKRTDCIEEANKDKKKHPFAALEALALSEGDAKAEETYNSVRKQWYEKCVSAPVLPLPAKGTYPGSTDSAVDIYTMKYTNAVSLNPKKWPRASVRMKSKLASQKAAAEKEEASWEKNKAVFEKAYSSEAKRRDDEKKAALKAQAKVTTPLVLPWMAQPIGVAKKPAPKEL